MPEIKTVLTKESEGYEVAYLQSLLKILGYRKNDPNGTFNLDTDHEVKSFQADNNLKINGVVDAETWQLLEAKAQSLSRVGVRIPYLEIEIPWWALLLAGVLVGGTIVGLVIRKK